MFCESQLFTYNLTRVRTCGIQIKVNSYVTMVLRNSIIEMDNTLPYLTARAVYIREKRGRLLYTIHVTVEAVQFVLLLFYFYCIE